MPAKTLPLLLVLLSPSTSAAPPTSDRLGDCHPAECRIPVDGMSPPQGARLSFSECRDGRKEDFAFELADGFWYVTSYATSQVPSCDPHAPVAAGSQ